MATARRAPSSTCTLPAKNGSCPVGYTPSANGTQTITAKDTAPGDNNPIGLHWDADMLISDKEIQDVIDAVRQAGRK